MKLIRLGILLTLLAVLLLNATPVYADTDDPDSTPSIESINIYRNLIETGDLLTLVYANIPYGTLPDTPVTETFIWSLIDTDNVTEFGSTVGTNYNDDGYGFNVYSMYFDADNVTAQGITWGTSYTLRLAGNPAVFDTPPIFNFSINAANYSVLTVRTEVQAELAARILIIAADLDNKWGLTSAASLITQNETATVLSLNGEAFFRGAIFGLQAMAPGVFGVVIRAIDLDDRTWNTTYSVNLTNQWEGTWAETAQEGGKALFGTDYDLLSIIMLLAMAGFLLYGNITLTGDHWNALIDVTVLGVFAARLGLYDFGFLMLVAALCIFYISAKVWFGIIK